MNAWLAGMTVMLLGTGPAAAQSMQGSAQLAHTAQEHASQKHASQEQASRLDVTHAWIRVLPGALPGAGYAVIRNHGNAPAVIVAARSRDYASVMLHQSSVRNGTSRMHAVSRLRIPAHGEVRLKPGGYHLMMMHATTQVQVGQQVPVELELADGSTLHARFLARPANAGGGTH